MRTLLVAAGLIVGLGTIEANAADNYQLVVCRTGNGLGCFVVPMTTTLACRTAAKDISEDLAAWGEINAWCVNKVSGDVSPVSRSDPNE